MINKCLTKGCKNHKGQGLFVGDLCSPCHKTTITGNIHHAGITFIHEMNRELKKANELLSETVLAHREYGDRLCLTEVIERIEKHLTEKGSV